MVERRRSLFLQRMEGWSPRLPTLWQFLTHNRYKREAYRGSPFAPRVLADNGIPVVMKVWGLAGF